MTEEQGTRIMELTTDPEVEDLFREEGYVPLWARRFGSWGLCLAQKRPGAARPGEAFRAIATKTEVLYGRREPVFGLNHFPAGARSRDRAERLILTMAQELGLGR
jgi:hypothetical protein